MMWLPALLVAFIFRPILAFSPLFKRKYWGVACWSEPESYRSISDYMGGHHAGKFDFDTRISGVTALNYEKSLVFDNCVRSSKNKALASIDDDEGDLPKWATRDVNLEAAVPLVLLKQQEGGGDVGEVRIENDEISWEPFYAAVVNGGEFINVSPACGKLAPRGGADNYSESWVLAVRAKELKSASREMKDVHIIVRTEEDHWVWKIQ